MRQGDGGRRKGSWGRFWSLLEAGEKPLHACAEDVRRTRQKALVDSLASELSRSGLGAVGIFLAEMSRPLGSVAATVLRVGEPGLAGVFGERRLANLACLFEDRETVDRLVERVEALDELK
jgi:hypothetical protein